MAQPANKELVEAGIIVNNNLYEFLYFDIEVYPNFWEVRGKSESDFFSIKSADFERLKDAKNIYKFLKTKILVGFNIKKYDMIILYHILFVNENPTYIKKLNDKIISSGANIYDISYWNKFTFIDLIDFAKSSKDEGGGSVALKMIAGNLGYNILESEIDFNSYITSKNIHLHDKYLDNDVEITKGVSDFLRELINVKVNISNTFNIPLPQALKSKLPKLGTIVAYNGKKFNTDFEGKYYKIPEKLITFFKENVDEYILEYYLNTPFEKMSLFEFEEFGNIGNFGKGGIHTFNNSKKINLALDGKYLFHDDYASQYPFIMMNFSLHSRGVDSDLLEGLIKTRLIAKAEGNKVVDGSYKEIINSLYGSCLDKYSPLYDPVMGYSITITGQLMIYAAAKIYNKIDGIEIIQCNTDGIVLECEEHAIEAHSEANKMISDITQINFESESLKKFYQFNVNNYLEIDEHDNMTTGGRIIGNNARNKLFSCNYLINEIAIREFAKNNTPIRQTVLDKKNHTIENFCAVIKVGSSYSNTYFGTFEKEDFKVQKINRILNVKNTNKKIYKQKITDSIVKNPEMLPSQGDGIIIANDQITKYDFNSFDIDFEWYIDMIEKKIEKLEE